MLRKFIFPIIVISLLSSCIELIDDITIHNDGSGTFKYSINLSSSRLKVNSILALDSLDGKKVPSMGEIKNKISAFTTALKSQNGLSNVRSEFDEANLILKLFVDFKTVGQLEQGIKNSIIAVSKEKSSYELNESWIAWDGKTLKRSVPLTAFKRSNEMTSSDVDLLKTGTYTSISRFDRSIDRTENVNAKLNPSKLACMLKVNTFDLRNNNKLIENSITLIPFKNK